MVLYLETSVPNFLFCTDAPERRAITETLFEQIHEGALQACVSDLYLEEVLALGEVELRNALLSVPTVYTLPQLRVDQQCAELADAYIAAKAFTAGNRMDALHVATAARHGCDLVVSWNFRHIVRAWTINKVAEVNMKQGIDAIMIVTPEEVIG